MVDAAADERPATAEAADSPAPTVDAPAADDVPAQLQFRDKQGMVLIFQLQSDLPAGVQEDLKRLIEVRLQPSSPRFRHLVARR